MSFIPAIMLLFAVGVDILLRMLDKRLQGGAFRAFADDIAAIVQGLWKMARSERQPSENRGNRIMASRSGRGLGKHCRGDPSLEPSRCADLWHLPWLC